MLGINLLIAAFCEWRYGIGNILKTFEKTKRRLDKATNFHVGRIDRLERGIVQMKQRSISHLSEVRRAASVGKKLEELIT
jgi:hypothetical protein